MVAIYLVFRAIQQPHHLKPSYMYATHVICRPRCLLCIARWLRVLSCRLTASFHTAVRCIINLQVITRYTSDDLFRHAPPRIIPFVASCNFVLGVLSTQILPMTTMYRSLPSLLVLVLSHPPMPSSSCICPLFHPQLLLTSNLSGALS